MEIGIELQRVTEQINPLIERAERAIQAIGLNVEGSVRLPSGPTLMYGRGPGGWGLSVLLKAGDPQTTQLIKTSRKTRLEALKALPDLVHELEMTVAVDSQQAREILRNASLFLDGLEK